MTTRFLSRAELAACSAEARARGRRLVLTNGVFDLLHVGHVRYLAAARSLGDCLAVAVNSDASVRALKGDGRPINPEDERAEILAALRSVDYVTVFGERTAEELVLAVRPGLYVKGGDYSPDPHDARFPVEGHTVLGYGGEVRILPLVPGRSTSALLATLSSSSGG